MTTRDPNDFRDPRVDAAWRAASREEPPPALDDAIRAAARREVGAGPQRASSVPEALRPERWWWPLAAAATIGAIAIGILQLANPDKVGGPASDKAVVSDMPVASEPAKKQLGQAARDEAAAPKREGAAKPAADAPAPSAAPASGEARDRVAPAAAPMAPAPPVTSKLRKDAVPPSAQEERAAANASAAPSMPAPAEMAQRPQSAVESATPEPRVAEPFPADALKRESKEGLVAGAAAPDKTSAAGGAAFATGKLDAAPAPTARGEAARDAQRAVAQPPAAAPPPAARRMQETDAPRAPSATNAVADAASETKPVGRAKAQPKLPVPDWIALIRKLRDEGRSDDAAKELAAFRAAYPDHERLLPPDLRDWHPAAK